MIKRTILFLSLIILPVALSGQTGTVYDDLTISSKILKTDKKYAIYLPAGYDTSERSYPVLYLLHGGGDDQKAWIQFGEVHAIAD